LNAAEAEEAYDLEQAALAAMRCRYTSVAAAVPDDSSEVRQPPAFANPVEAAIRYLLCCRSSDGSAVLVKMYSPVR
jgi:hypothetical protein